MLPPHPYGGGRTAYTGVTPEVVVELFVDLAVDGLRWRHPVRFVRVRGELTAADLAGAARAVGVSSRHPESVKHGSAGSRRDAGARQQGSKGEDRPLRFISRNVEL